MKGLYRKTKAYVDLLEPLCRRTVANITDVGMLECDYKEMGAPLPDASLFTPYDMEDGYWGRGTDTHAFFHFFVDVPDGYDGKDVFLRVSTQLTSSPWDPNNPQFIAFVDGELRQGLDINHREVCLKTTGRHEIYLYAYTGIKVERSTLKLELIVIDRAIEKLWYDIKVPFDSLDLLDEGSYEYHRILDKLDGALLLIDTRELGSKTFYDSVEAASKYMDEEFYGKFCSVDENEPQITAIGHTHIDCAWQWTLKQTREKVQRSFSTVTELMEQYPEYRFMSSQALLYQNLKEEAPEVYEKVKKLIADGKWECEGAMWVEADCNLSSGESLVRQVLYGKRFFKEEFGVDNRVLWLPDVFGYSAALPQILKKSGVDWFVTSKISWNDTNKMPCDTFIWKGIDGTGINTFFITAQNKIKGQQPQNRTTYVGKITPQMAVGAYDRYQQKALFNEAMITFGFGDGGGGPTATDLEIGRRLSKGIPGVPPVKIRFAGEMLRELEKKMEGSLRLPVWQGELYLEYHRATYTTLAKNKKKNRRSESLYLNTEWLSTLAKNLCALPFPKKELHRGWEMILTNQFHDIIPGSSIHEVYEQSDIDYEVVRQIGTEASRAAESALTSAIDKKHGYVVFNPNPTKGSGMLKLDGKTVYVQDIPAKGYACRESFVDSNHVKVSKTGMENARFRLTFDKDMMISSIYDKQEMREVIKAGARGNELRIYSDHPDKYDAWEWNDFSMEKMLVIDDLQSVETVEDGVRAGVKITRRYLNSTLTQTIWMSDVSDRIDFETEVDWHERHQMLKAAFPVDISSPRATYEIQYGTTERPTHKNTSWDMAKFEVCAHRFADLSEGNYGVAMLNDCKYGHDIHDGVMTLSLLRGSTFPDPEADQGINRFTYSILPHAGQADILSLYREAYDLNSPMTALRATGNCDRIPSEFAYVQSNKENILCEVVKEAEDSTDTILRLFECNNSKTRATLTFGLPVKSVILCDMSENELTALPVTDNSVTLDFGPFEIHTLKIVTE